MPSGRDSVRSDRRRSWPRPKSPSCCTERDRAQSPHQETRSRSRRLSSGRFPIPENMRADSNPEESSRKNLLFFLHSVLNKFQRRTRHLAFSYARLTFTSAIRMTTCFPNARAARVTVSPRLFFVASKAIDRCVFPSRETLSWEIPRVLATRACVNLRALRRSRKFISSAISSAARFSTFFR